MWTGSILEPVERKVRNLVYLMFDGRKMDDGSIKIVICDGKKNQ